MDYKPGDIIDVCVDTDKGLLETGNDTPPSHGDHGSTCDWILKLIHPTGPLWIQRTTVRGEDSDPKPVTTKRGTYHRDNIQRAIEHDHLHTGWQNWKAEVVRRWKDGETLSEKFGTVWDCVEIVGK